MKFKLNMIISVICCVCLSDVTSAQNPSCNRNAEGAVNVPSNFSQVMNPLCGNDTEAWAKTTPLKISDLGTTETKYRRNDASNANLYTIWFDLGVNNFIQCMRLSYDCKCQYTGIYYRKNSQGFLSDPYKFVSSTDPQWCKWTHLLHD